MKMIRRGSLLIVLCIIMFSGVSFSKIDNNKERVENSVFIESGRNENAVLVERKRTESNRRTEKENKSEDVIDEETFKEIYISQKQEIDFDGIQDEIEESLQGYEFNIEIFVDHLFKGEFDLDSQSLMAYVLKEVFIDLRGYASMMIKLLLIVIFGAIFNNVGSSFDNKQIIQLSDMVIDVVIITIILSSYQIANQVVMSVLNAFDEFIKCLVPSMMSVSMLSGSLVSGNIFAQSIMVLSGIINKFVNHILVPYLYLIIVFIILNTLSENNSFKNMIALLKKGYTVIMKVITAIYIGVYSLQSLGLPSVDTMVAKTAKNTISSVPVVGITISELSEIVFSCGVATKNILGIGVIVAGIFISLFPVIKVLTMGFVYKLIGAVIEPITKAKLSNCLAEVGEVCFMLLGIVVFVVFLFIISVALTVYVSNARQYVIG